MPSFVYRILMVAVLGVISPWLKSHMSAFWYVVISLIYLMVVVAIEFGYRKWRGQQLKDMKKG